MGIFFVLLVFVPFSLFLPMLFAFCFSLVVFCLSELLVAFCLSLLLLLLLFLLLFLLVLLLLVLLLLLLLLLFLLAPFCFRSFFGFLLLTVAFAFPCLCLVYTCSICAYRIYIYRLCTYIYM